MAKRRKTNIGSSAGKDDYEVGYGKPPKHGQFKPGQSGNPGGRRKGLRNFKTDVLATPKMPVKFGLGARPPTRSTQQSALMMMRNKACQGHDRSLERLFDFAQRFNSDAGETGAGQTLSADDQAILDAHKAEILAGAAATPATITKPTHHPNAQVRRRRITNE